MASPVLEPQGQNGVNPVPRLKSKLSTRPRPDITHPLSLKDMCCDVITLSLLKIAKTRNARVVKSVRNYIQSNLWPCLQKDLLMRNVHIGPTGANNLIRMYNLFPPNDIMRGKVDLIGHYVCSDWCQVSDDDSDNAGPIWNWGNGNLFCMTIEQCKKLFLLLLWSDPKKLIEFKMCSYAGNVIQSRIPSILARATLLKSFTLLMGATNHTLRILGLHCPNLEYLNVTGSNGVNNAGLAELFLRFPRHGSDETRTRCARTLKKFVIFRTKIDIVGCQEACRLMGDCYIQPLFPDSAIIRPDQHNLCHSGVPYRFLMSPDEKPDLYVCSVEFVTIMSTLIQSMFTDMSNVVIDLYGHPPRMCQVYLRTLSPLLHGILELQNNRITKLVIGWNTIGMGDWKWGQPPHLSSLVQCVPHLKFLQARLDGRWNLVGDFFPHLESADIWTLDHRTIEDFLTYAPALKSFDGRYLGSRRFNLTHDTLVSCVTTNANMFRQLIQLVIRPTKLTRESVMHLIQQCPNLRLLGDLENWEVTTEDVKEVNEFLDQINSQCVLSLVNFPPKQPSF